MLVKRIKYGDYLDEWLGIKKRTIKLSTYATYSNHVENHIRPFLGRKYIHKIDGGFLQMFIDQLYELDLSNKTIIDIVVIVKGTLKDALKMNYIKKIDFESIIIPKVQNDYDFKLFSSFEQAKIIQKWNESHLTDLLGIIICMNTGLRIGEICALKWDDIDMDERIVYVHKTLQRIYIKDKEKSESEVLIGSTKTNSSKRVVPINSFLYKLLKDQQKKGSCFVISGNESYIEPRKYRTIYSRFLNELSIEYRCFHTLRHTFATNCIELGIDYKTLSELLGHASVTTTMKIYVHSKMDMKRNGMEKLSDFLIGQVA